MYPWRAAHWSHDESNVLASMDSCSFTRPGMCQGIFGSHTGNSFEKIDMGLYRKCIACGMLEDILCK